MIRTLRSVIPTYFNVFNPKLITQEDKNNLLQRKSINPKCHYKKSMEEIKNLKSGKNVLFKKNLNNDLGTTCFARKLVLPL